MSQVEEHPLIALRNYKRSLQLSRIQQELLIGGLLGDGNLRIAGRNRHANFIVEHSMAQQEYVLWKYCLMKEWVLTEPKAVTRVYHKDSKRVLHSLRFLTISHPEFTKWHSAFYERKIKRIPKNIQEILISPLSLAIWLMDDGNKNHRALFLNTQQFCLEDQELLMYCLKSNFDLEATINRHSIYADKQFYRIRLTTAATEKLFAMTKDFLLPSMRYKFPLYPRNDLVVRPDDDLLNHHNTSTSQQRLIIN